MLKWTSVRSQKSCFLLSGSPSHPGTLTWQRQGLSPRHQLLPTGLTLHIYLSMRDSLWKCTGLAWESPKCWEVWEVIAVIQSVHKMQEKLWTGSSFTRTGTHRCVLLHDKWWSQHLPDFGKPCGQSWPPKPTWRAVVSCAGGLQSVRSGVQYQMNEFVVNSYLPHSYYLENCIFTYHKELFQVCWFTDSAQRNKTFKQAVFAPNIKTGKFTGNKQKHKSSGISILIVERRPDQCPLGQTHLLIRTLQIK